MPNTSDNPNESPLQKTLEEINAMNSNQLEDYSLAHEKSQTDPVSAEQFARLEADPNLYSDNIAEILSVEQWSSVLQSGIMRRVDHYRTRFKRSLLGINFH